MAGYQLTDRANAELDAIYEYSILNFGLKKARAYLEGFHVCFETLGRYPQMGRDYNRLKTGYRRYQYESHVIYYRSSADGVRIMRILHKSQDPMQNL